MLLTELGDVVKVEISNIRINITEDNPKSVSERERETERERERERERELAGLQYIKGDIVHKLHNKFRNHKNWRYIEL